MWFTTWRIWIVSYTDNGFKPRRSFICGYTYNLFDYTKRILEIKQEFYKTFFNIIYNSIYRIFIFQYLDSYIINAKRNSFF